MKSFAAFMLIILFVSFSCKEDEKRGICTACCDANGKEICKENFTDKMCSDYNNNKTDGHDWAFTEGGTICAPSPPL